MDDIDRANEALERAAEHHRAHLARQALRPARVYECCRWCHEALSAPDLRQSGFCTVSCREDYELSERVARLAGRAS